ncbi:N-acetyltransferase 10, partial [Mytilus galloprovincialis]
NLNEILEADVEKDMVARKEITLEPVKQTMDEELNEAANEVLQKQRQEAAVLSGIDLTNYAIRGSEHDWQKALSGSNEKKGLVSVKSNKEKKRKPESNLLEEFSTSAKKKKDKKKHKH